MEWTGIGRLVIDERWNASLAWVLTVLVLLVAIESLVVGDLLWTAFAATVSVLALLPAAAFRTPRVMLPWEVLGLAALPIVARAFGSGQIGEFATYLSVAALALIIAVELHTFTAVEMTYWFAVLFVVVTTMATAGIWAVVRWVADIYLGTGFITSEEALMWEFVSSTIAGLGAGVVFEFYIRRRIRTDERVPPTRETA